MSPNRRNNQFRRRGFTLIEAVVSTLLVGLLLVGSLSSLEYALRSRRLDRERTVGRLILHELATEILNRDYDDPNGATASIGLEPGETGKNRLLYDDVDDYHKLVETPPVRRNGNALSSAAQLTRTTIVDFVDPLDPTKVLKAGNGVKRVTISISLRGQVLNTLSFLRTGSYQ